MTNAGPAGADALVDAGDLAELLGRPSSPLGLDVRWRLTGPPGLDDYLAGHIPGAVFCDLEHVLAAPPGKGGRHPLPTSQRFEREMRALGLRADRDVVVYDDGDALPAARAWWCLRYFGHDRARVLDGGYAAWAEAGYPVDTGPVQIEPGDFVAFPGGLAVIDAAGAGELARTGVLLDVRAAERYRAEAEPIDPIAGHIPGAVNAPAAGNLTGAGRFRPAAELRARYQELGVGPHAAVGAYCGSGITAAQTVLALSIAGVPAALYPGSWSNWITDSSRPIAIGPDAG